MEKIVIHPEYIENDEVSFHKNDIALIKLNKNVPFNDAIQRACWKEGDVAEPAAQDIGLKIFENSMSMIRIFDNP